MKSVALSLVALGLLLAMAAPSLAHGYCGPVHHYHHGAYYYGGYSPVVVAPAPVYGYPTYPPVVTPAVAPVVTPVVPGPYYYGAPGVYLGYRGPRVAIRVGL
ncbi:MAG: hypothetical protein ACLP9L_33560 [Thermoguttaceae bacterium]